LHELSVSHCIPIYHLSQLVTRSRDSLNANGCIEESELGNLTKIRKKLIWLKHVIRFSSERYYCCVND